MENDGLSYLERVNSLRAFIPNRLPVDALFKLYHAKSTTQPMQDALILEIEDRLGMKPDDFMPF